MQFERHPIEEKIEHLVEPILKTYGYVLVDVEFKEGRYSYLKIFVDREDGGITLKELEMLTNEISVMLDVEDPIPHSYTLEISSPGLDRELRKEREIRWALGKKVIAFLKGGGQVSGKLTAYEEDSIVIDDMRINLDQLSKLKLNEV